MIFLIGLSIGYYFIIHLPQINEEKFVLVQQQKCREVGEQAYKTDLRQYNVDILNDPEYTYSQKLKTCIYRSGYHDQGDISAGVDKTFLESNCNAYWKKWVKDSYTNKELLSISSYKNDKCEWTLSIEEIHQFDVDSDNLFSKNN